MFDSQVVEFKKQYDEIFLIRNERYFKLFSFDD